MSNKTSWRSVASFTWLRLKKDDDDDDDTKTVSVAFFLHSQKRRKSGHST